MPPPPEPPPLRRVSPAGTRVPFVSVIIPVFREGAAILRTLADLERIGFGESDEKIVVDGDDQGGTLRMIRDERVIRVTAPKGRGSQMNAGARAARGEVLLFLHADTRLPAGGRGAIRSALGRGDAAGGAFDLGIDSPRPVYRLIEQVASIRSRITRIPYGDQALFLRADFFRRVGGFREIPIMEDVDLMRRVKGRGATITILKDRVMTSPRRWEREGVVYATLRNWFLMARYLAGDDPRRLARHYRNRAGSGEFRGTRSQGIT